MVIFTSGIFYGTLNQKSQKKDKKTYPKYWLNICQKKKRKIKMKKKIFTAKDNFIKT